MCPKLSGVGLERENLTSLYTWVRTDLLQLLQIAFTSSTRFYFVVIRRSGQSCIYLKSSSVLTSFQMYILLTSLLGIRVAIATLGRMGEEICPTENPH